MEASKLNCTCDLKAITFFTNCLDPLFAKTLESSKKLQVAFNSIVAISNAVFNKEEQSGNQNDE